MTRKGAIVLGWDPGLGTGGLSVVRLKPGQGEEVLELLFLQTKKSAKKRTVFASDDNLRRAQELAAEILAVIDKHHPIAICCEAMSHPRNSGTAHKVGISWGVLATLAWARRLPVIQQSPQEIKLRVAGSETASKDRVEAALRDRYRGQLERFDEKISPSHREHPYDSLAAVVACLRSELLLLARNTG